MRCVHNSRGLTSCDNMIEMMRVLLPWKVNLAVVVDGSRSVSAADFALEQDFAMDAVNAFADRNLFDNGGTASYVQYSTALVSSGMFDSALLFNDFVDADTQSRGGTTTSVGIDEGTRLLGINPASASFMIVITDGQSSSTAATAAAADAARAEGITVFAVGVGEPAAARCRSCQQILGAKLSRPHGRSCMLCVRSCRDRSLRRHEVLGVAVKLCTCRSWASHCNI